MTESDRRNLQELADRLQHGRMIQPGTWAAWLRRLADPPADPELLRGIEARRSDAEFIGRLRRSMGEFSDVLDALADEPVGAQQ